MPRIHQGTRSLAPEPEVRKPLTHRRRDRQKGKLSQRGEQRCEPQRQAAICLGALGTAQGEGASLAVRLILFLHWAEHAIKLRVDKHFEESTAPTTHRTTGLWLTPRLLFPSSPRWATGPRPHVAGRLRSVFGVCSHRRYPGARQVSRCVSLYRRGSGDGEGRRAHQHQAAAEVKRVGLKTNLTPTTRGNISVYFNSKTIPVFQATSHLDVSRKYFCFPVLPYRGKVSEVMALPASAHAEPSPTTHRVLPSLTQTPPRHRNHFHKQRTTGPDSVSLLGEEQEENISF